MIAIYTADPGLRLGENLMREVGKGIYVGDDSDCFHDSRTGWSVIHACKTCHKRRIGYSGNLDCGNPHYLILRDSNHLYLNLVDMERTLMPKFTHPIVKVTMDFIHENTSRSKVLIHCNEGHSRAPSIAMLYLAKASSIPNGSHEDAKEEFLRIFPSYSPALGIESYMRQYWDELMKL